MNIVNKYVNAKTAEALCGLFDKPGMTVILDSVYPPKPRIGQIFVEMETGIIKVYDGFGWNSLVELSDEI